MLENLISKFFIIINIKDFNWFGFQDNANIFGKYYSYNLIEFQAMPISIGKCYSCNFRCKNGF